MTESIFSKLSIEWLHDIINNASSIENYIEDHRYEDFIQDRRTQDAVERCLERISEASSRLYKKTPEVLDKIPDVIWHQIRGLGNYLRHEYDGLDIEVIWHIATHDVTPLKKAVQKALRDFAA
jgi:uncharacterized protein with HEPN domain